MDQCVQSSTRSSRIGALRPGVRRRSTPLRGNHAPRPRDGPGAGGAVGPRHGGGERGGAGARVSGACSRVLDRAPTDPVQPKAGRASTPLHSSHAPRPRWHDGGGRGGPGARRTGRVQSSTRSSLTGAIWPAIRRRSTPLRGSAAARPAARGTSGPTEFQAAVLSRWRRAGRSRSRPAPRPDPGTRGRRWSSPPPAPVRRRPGRAPAGPRRGGSPASAVDR